MNGYAMLMLNQLKDIASRWIEIVALSMIRLSGRFRSRRVVQFLEREDGSFEVKQINQPQAWAIDEPLRIVDDHILNPPPGLGAMMRGSWVELVLRSNRFIFRPLELPRRAGEFLDGIVRAQIDRLTPWTADAAIFGWSDPTEVANDRILVTIAATARTLLTPLLQAITALGAEAVSVSTVGDHEAATPQIKVLEQGASCKPVVRRLSRALVGILLISGVAAAAGNAASFIVGGDLDAQQSELSRLMAARRTVLRLESGAGGGAHSLEQRKHEVPSSVMVLEALSKLLPDHTYVTELRIEGDKLQVVGITHDAPALIRLMEQSRYFVHATFFAPTTRAPGDPGDHFHIEARIEPIFVAPT